MKYPILILFLISCTSTRKNNTNSFSCSNLKKDIANMSDYCDKLSYLERNYNVYCSIDILTEIGKLTGHEPRFSLGTGGVYYEQDSLYFNDINEWKKYYKCK